MRLRDFVGIIRELSFSEIRHEAMIPPRLLIIAPSIESGREWAHRLFGSDADMFAEVIDSSDSSVDPLAYDVLISVGPLGVVRGRAWAELFRRANTDMLLVEVDPKRPADEAALERVRRKMCDIARDRSVAFGRHIESMRHAATCEVVSDTSRVNAQFAALSNIPALIPVVGTVFAAGADFIVLTKNQLMMMYRLAAIHDRDLDDRWRIYAELVPVVGSGLLWRTAARQIAAILPVVLGAVPKVTIAYAGTYAVGQAARVYYEHGERLAGEELDAVYREAVSTLYNARSRILGEPHPELASQAEPADSGSRPQ